MAKAWNTKYGPRKVREEPPTLDEAIYAAIGLTDDPQQQAEIAAALMDMPLDKVRTAVQKAAQKRVMNRDVMNRGVTFTKRAGAERAVVVERKVTRRLGGYRPLG